MKQLLDFLTLKENQQFVLNKIILVFAILLYVFSTEIANYQTTVDEAWFRWKNILMFDFTLVIYSLRNEVKNVVSKFGYKIIYIVLLNYFFDQYLGFKGWSWNDYLTVILIGIEAIIATLKNRRK